MNVYELTREQMVQLNGQFFAQFIEDSITELLEQSAKDREEAKQMICDYIMHEDYQLYL